MTLGDSYEQMVRLIPQRTWLGAEFGLSVEDLLEMLPVRSAQEASRPQVLSASMHRRSHIATPTARRTFRRQPAWV